MLLEKVKLCLLKFPHFLSIVSILVFLGHIFQQHWHFPSTLSIVASAAMMTVTATLEGLIIVTTPFPHSAPPTTKHYWH